MGEHIFVQRGEYTWGNVVTIKGGIIRGEHLWYNCQRQLHVGATSLPYAPLLDATQWHLEPWFP
jgi:hypothetical protein